MKKINKEILEDLAHLCCIRCSQETKEKLFRDLASILGYIELLSELDTEGEPPCDHVLEAIQNVMRVDREGTTLKREVFLENSPSHVGGMVRVPPVIKF